MRKLWLLSKLLIPLISVVVTDSSLALPRLWSNDSNTTIFFDEPVSVACNSTNDTILYKTSLGQIEYRGTLWIEEVSGCNTNQVVIRGYFRDTSTNGTERCAGQLTISLTPGNGQGSVTWSNIRSVRGLPCSGAGQTYSLNLYFDR
jgi:hypothetical protein